MLLSLLQQEAHLVKVDLKDAYLTVPMAKGSQPLLAFRNQGGDLFQFKVLPFGLCTAPYVFTKLTKPIVQFLRSVGIQILIYLDNMLICAPSEQQLLEQLSTVLWLLAALGFIINVPKSVLIPSKQIDFLGFTQLNDHNITTSQESGGTEGDIAPTQVPLSTGKDPGMSVRETGGNKTSRVHCPPTLLCVAESEYLCTACPMRDSSPLTRGNQ